MENYNRHNFHKKTFCIFHARNLSEIENRNPDYTSKSGSRYYFTESGVYRIANHWGRAADCKWRLQHSTESDERNRLGFASWTDFHPDNDFQKLYFIQYDPQTGSVTFNHKSRQDVQRGLLRTASETTKRIRQIRHLLSDNAWEKYIPGFNSTLRSRLIAELIETDKSWQEIKADLQL